LQGKKFDPGGSYVRKYVAEIENVPDRFLHNPWEAPTAVLDDAGVFAVIGLQCECNKLAGLLCNAAANDNLIQLIASAHLDRNDI